MNILIHYEYLKAEDISGYGINKIYSSVWMEER